MFRPPPASTLFPYTTLFRSSIAALAVCFRDCVCGHPGRRLARGGAGHSTRHNNRSEEHTSELKSLTNLVCRLLLEKKKKEAEILNITGVKTNKRHCARCLVV